ncbi:hypothetical protein RHGRI_002729 [Rhododendron griersonianum]|uniref:Uncharacterized protein n=1 Tax=Rhododendron griersonianum TaxID=479676 RepID=A0AAV6LSV9_9ERIC|nr:hypothetical protein RHGRI_002729 [Rhododendron griersonianum]
MSDTKTTTHLSTLVISALHLIFSFILSHPVYFSYFVFFSPYLLKLLSFLSPLFITTSLLLLLGFLALSPVFLHKNSALELPESKLGFFLSTYHSIMQRLRPSKTDEGGKELDHFEEIEAFKMVFNPSNDFHAIENSDEKTEELCFFGLEEKTVEIDWEEITQPSKEAKTLEGFFKELDEFEDFVYNVERKKVEAPDTNFDKVKVKKGVEVVGRGSEEIGDKTSRDIGTVTARADNGGEHTSKARGKSERNVDRTDNGGEYTSMFLGSRRSRTLESNLGSYGSMRREVEWKKTLACKLFEERNNVGGGEEGMDSLWEAYDRDSSNKAKAKSNTKKNKKKNKKKGKSGYRYEDDEEEEEEEEEGIDGKLCCLQALKFSAGKVNLGMGRPNLVKISKAIKGFGWLHHVSSRPGKKGHK